MIQIEGAEEPVRKKEKGGGHQLEPGSGGLFQATGGRDGTAVPETNRFVPAGLREEGQKADNEVGGIAATNYSSGSKCLVAVRARIALEEIGLIKL